MNRRKPLLQFATAGILACALSGCIGATWSTLEYEVDSSVMAEGPPMDSGEGTESSDFVNSYPEIQIEPENATGYEDLSEDIKMLFEESSRPITIDNVVHEALRNNREIRIEGYGVDFAKSGIPISKSIYDLLVTGSYDFRRELNQPTSQLSAAGVARRRESQFGLRQLTPLGGDIQFGHTYNYVMQDFMFSAFNPSITHALSVSVTQPILEGFGPRVTNADIYISMHEYEAASADFEAQIQNQLRDSLEAYWDLTLAVNTFDVQVIAYTAALDLLRINEAKERLGVVAPTEVLQARARAEARRESILQARQSVRDAEDRLKRLAFFSDPEAEVNVPNWDLQLQPMQELAWREIEIDLAATLADAYGNRPELRGLQARLDQRDLEIIQSRDMLKPSLDLKASYSIDGTDMDNSMARDIMDDGEFNTYVLGMEFQHPLQNRQARYRVRQTKTLREQTLERILQQQDLITMEVRQAARAVKTARERIDISRARVESEQANLSAEQKRYEVGVSTSFQVLEFQEFLANAQQSYVQSVVDYNKAMISFERARGTLLDTYGVRIINPELDPETSERPIIFPVGLN